jgi:hypothetical protein
MRKLSLILGVLAIISLVAAPISSAWAGTGASNVKKHEMTVSVVSVNAEAKTMTFKTETGEEKTAPFIGQAINKAKDVKAGDKVTITCTDKENGEHEGISDIKAAPKA